MCPPVGSAQYEARGTGCEPPAEGRARFSVAAATAAAVDAGIKSVCVRARQAGVARSCARRQARARRGAGAVAGASRCAGAVVGAAAGAVRGVLLEDKMEPTSVR